MPKLFVDKTIEINAPAEKVWEALTKREHTDAWAAEFSSGGPRFHIESDWKPDSPVLWKIEDGTVVVEGTVTALQPNRLLRFTVFDVRSAEKPRVTKKDGITYELAEKNGRTTLHVLQGDFSVMKEGQKYQRMSAEIWERVLPKVKALAETSGLEEEPTCGKGLASQSELPAKCGELMAALAENLELHMKTLDLTDQNARKELDAYMKLAREYREVAALLDMAANQMAGYRNLPMARHDMLAMLDLRLLEAFEKFTGVEQELLTMLEKHLEHDQNMLGEMRSIRKASGA
jgi:uncharacterized protein YndB with AHSA1/START domain